MLGDIRGAVRGPCDGHLLPGQEEDDSAIAGGRVQQPHVVRAGREEGPGSEREWGGGTSVCPCTPSTQARTGTPHLFSGKAVNE